MEEKARVAKRVEEDFSAKQKTNICAIEKIDVGRRRQANMANRAKTDIC